MTSYFHLVQKIYLANPNTTPTGLWIELCKGFIERGAANNKPLEEKTRAVLFPALPSYRTLANQFVNRNILLSPTDHKDDPTTEMMKEINEAFKQNDFTLDTTDPFVNLLKTFLTCEPDFEELFDTSVKQKLNVKAYMPYKTLDDRLERALQFVYDEKVDPLSEQELGKINELRVLFDLCDLQENEYKLLNNLIMRIARVERTVHHFLVRGDAFKPLQLDENFWDNISDDSLSRIAQLLITLFNQPIDGLRRFCLDSLVAIIPRLPQIEINKVSKLLIKPLFEFMAKKGFSKFVTVELSPEDTKAREKAALFIITILKKADKKHQKEGISHLAELYKKYSKDNSSEANTLLSVYLSHGGTDELALPLEEMINTTSFDMTIEIMQLLVADLNQDPATTAKYRDPDLTKNEFAKGRQTLDECIQTIKNKSLPEGQTADSTSTQDLHLDSKPADLYRDDRSEDHNYLEEMRMKFRDMGIVSEILKKNNNLPMNIKNQILDVMIKYMSERIPGTNNKSIQVLIQEQIAADTIPTDKLIAIAEKIRTEISTCLSRRDDIQALYSEIFELASHLPRQDLLSLMDPLLDKLEPSASLRTSLKPHPTSLEILASIAPRLPFDIFKNIIKELMDRKLQSLPQLEIKADDEKADQTTLTRWREGKINSIDESTNTLTLIFKNIADHAERHKDDESLAPVVQYSLNCLLKMSETTLTSPLLSILADIATYQHIPRTGAEALLQLSITFLSDTKRPKGNDDIDMACTIINAISPNSSAETQFQAAEAIATHGLEFTANYLYHSMGAYACLIKLSPTVPPDKLNAFVKKLLNGIEKLDCSLATFDAYPEAFSNLILCLKNNERELMIERLSNIMIHGLNMNGRKMASKMLILLSAKVTPKVATQMIDYYLLPGHTADIELKESTMVRLEKLLLEPHFVYKLDDAHIKKITDFILDNLNVNHSFYQKSALLNKLYSLEPKKFIERLANHDNQLVAFTSICNLISQKLIPFVETNPEEKNTSPDLECLDILINKVIQQFNESGDNTKRALFPLILNPLSNFPEAVFHIQPYKKLLDTIFKNPGLTSDVDPDYHIDTIMIKKIPEDKIIQLLNHQINAIPAQIKSLKQGINYSRRKYYNTVAYEQIFKRTPEANRVAAIDKLLQDLLENESGYNFIRENCVISLINSLSPDKQNYYLFAVIPERMNRLTTSAVAQRSLLSITKEVSTHRIIAHELGSKNTSAPSILLDYLGGGPS